MQGIYVNYERVKTKKIAVAAIKEHPETVTLEATSFFGNEYDGPILGMPVGTHASVVGPDPYKLRNWYLNLTRTKEGFKVT